MKDEYDVTYHDVRNMGLTARMKPVGEQVGIRLYDDESSSVGRQGVLRAATVTLMYVNGVGYALDDIEEFAVFNPKSVPFYRRVRAMQLASWLRDYWIGIAGLALAIAGIAWIGALVERDARYEQKLMADCLADGHKEYQCVSLLRKPSSDSTTVVPIYIPR